MFPPALPDTFRLFPPKRASIAGSPAFAGGERVVIQSGMSNLRPVTVITGASAGIGVALARIFARNGHTLALVARREDRLRQLADEIAAIGLARPIVIVADLTQGNSAKTIGDALSAQCAEPQYMVNNAGFGLVGVASSLGRDEQLAMIDLNVRVLTELSLAFVDSLERHHGGLLNVGSMAGFLPGPGMAVYYATKAYVLSFSEALHSEFKPRGIRVTVLCPGPVPTEFAARAGISEGLAPGTLTQSAESVAAAGYDGLMRGKRTVVPGLANKLVIFLIRIVPRRLLLRLVDSRQSRRRSVQRT
jgi:short-subunit dehydrogenase